MEQTYRWSCRTSERILEIDVCALPLHIAALGEPLPDDCRYQTLISLVGFPLRQPSCFVSAACSKAKSLSVLAGAGELHKLGSLLASCPSDPVYAAFLPTFGSRATKKCLFSTRRAPEIALHVGQLTWPLGHLAYTRTWPFSRVKIWELNKCW